MQKPQTLFNEINDLRGVKTPTSLTGRIVTRKTGTISASPNVSHPRGNVRIPPPDTDAHGKTGFMATLGGSVYCLQCSANSKRSGLQCRSPAMKDKRVCALHGGKSTGPQTQAGRDRIATANTIHGRETRSMRIVRSLALKRIAELVAAARGMGLIVGHRTPGPKPA
jgi:hypothetical protein